MSPTPAASHPLPSLSSPIGPRPGSSPWRPEAIFNIFTIQNIQSNFNKFKFFNNNSININFIQFNKPVPSQENNIKWCKEKVAGARRSTARK